MYIVVFVIFVMIFLATTNQARISDIIDDSLEKISAWFSSMFVPAEQYADVVHTADSTPNMTNGGNIT